MTFLTQMFVQTDDLIPDPSQYGYIAMNPYGSDGLAQVYMSGQHLRRILPDSITVFGPIQGAFSKNQSGYLLSHSRAADRRRS